MKCVMERLAGVLAKNGIRNADIDGDRHLYWLFGG